MQYRYKKNGVTLKLNKRNLALIAVILASVTFIILAAKVYPWSKTWVDYNGMRLTFDVNLMDAKNVPVYPNEAAVKGVMGNPGIQKLTFVFQNTSDASLTKVETVDIVLKLSYAMTKFNPGFFNSTIEVKSFDGLSTVAEDPYIVLMPPSVSDGTYVKVVGNSIFISGKTKGDFYMATAKFVMSALGISL